MSLFLRFMGWLILYSLFYFVSLDFTLDPPGKEGSAFHKVFNYGILLVISIPCWWFSWKKFERTFGPTIPTDLGNGQKAYRFALRNPALLYYLMVLKIFLLALGLNGILTLSQHKSGLRTFYIINFIVLYIYAIPFFLIKFNKLKKALASRLIVDSHQLILETSGKTITDISLANIDMVLAEDSASGMVVQAGDASLYLGGQSAKGSSFYIGDAQEICEKIRVAVPDKIERVESIKQAMKAGGIKPVL